MSIAATREDHRRRLMAGLAECVRERGLARTHVTDIVRIARASRRTFYAAFPDKDECFLALAETLLSDTLERIEAAVDRTAPPAERVDAAIDTYISILAADPAMTLMLARDLPALGERGVRVHRAAIERYAQALTDVADGTLSIHQAVLLVGGLRELVVRAVDRGEPLDELAAVAKAVFGAALR